MLVIEGPSGNGIGRSVASALGCESIEVSRKLFPDGESEIVIPGEVRGKDVVIVQSLYPYQDKGLVELLILADELRKEKAKSIKAVIPYLAYARQDMKFEGKNNAVSISTVLDLLGYSGITTLFTVAPHKSAPLSAFHGAVKVIDGSVPLARALKGNVKMPFVLAADKSATHMAQNFAETLKCDYASMEKQRDRLTGKIRMLSGPDKDFDGMDVVIVDDMISSGGTVVQTAEFAKKKGAKRIVAAAVHLLMIGDAAKKLKEAGVSELYGTNTVLYPKAHITDISEAVADALKK